MRTFSPDIKDSPSQIDETDLLPTGSHIIVIGAGAFGGWTALFLQRKGYKVTLVEQWGPGNSRASSGGETRLMRCIYGTNPYYTSLANRAYTLWQENEPLLGKRFLYPTGCLWFSDTNADDLVWKALPIIKNEGLSYEIISPEELSEKYPQINAKGCDLIFEKKAGYLMAREGCQAVRSLFEKEGGQYLRGQARIGKMSHQKLEEIALDERTLTADRYLFACGPWLKDLFPEVLSSLITISRQEVFYFGLPAQKTLAYEAIPPWIDHGPPNFYYGVPSGIGRGFKIAFDRRGPEVDPSNHERSPTPEEIEKARHYIEDRFGLNNLPLLESRVCQYSDTQDGNFIVDSHPEADNVWLLGGGSGHGYKHGPAVGELLSNVFAGDEPVPSDLRLKIR